MPKKKDHKRKPSRLNYTAPRPSRPILWIHISPGLALLRFRPQLREGKVAAMARRIKNPSACIVAPIFAAVEDFDHWFPSLVENIFQLGDEVHRITQQQLKLRWNSSFPIACVSPTFYVNRNKVSILVKSCQLPKALHGGVTSAVEPDQLTAIESLLNANHGLVIQCGGRTNSYWKDKGKYFALVPEGFGSSENYTPSLLRAVDLKTLLEHSLALEQGVCDLFAVKILEKSTVPMSIKSVQRDFELPEISESDLRIRVAEAPAPEAVAPESEAVQVTAAKRKDKKAVEESEPVDAINPDVIISFSEDYKAIDDTRGILTGNSFVSQPDRILHTVLAAAVFLHHLPANLWTRPVIKDIIALGKKVFYESEEEDLLKSEDWMDRVHFPIKFARREFQADFEKVVFGKVTSTDPEVLSVERGLSKFFQGNDVGLLIGPQLVLVWQMKNNYFMFDPKERDPIGRKWTRMYSAELGESGNSGSACITWFQSLKKLSEVYTDTIALKHRKDPYRIVRLRVFETCAKLEPEGEWFGLATDKWIVVGTKTICDYSFAEDKHRSGKALCMGIAALLCANEVPESEWNSSVVDSILLEGMELFKQSLAGLAPEQPFTIGSVKKLVDIGERRVRLFVVECMIRGMMLGEQTAPSDKGGVVLRDGITEFFNSTRFGLFTVKSVALAVWRGRDNFFYLFYPYEKLLGLPPHCLCSNDPSLPPMGLANSMRFKTLEDMLNFLTCSLNTKENDEYCLSPVDLFLSEAGGRPPLREYEEFGESGGILRPYKSLHEGHEMFGVRADKQTLANLLTAIGFNRLTPATHWTKEELADILHIGDKVFCRVFMALVECQARDYVLQWDDVVPVIGMNKFTFSRDPIVGVMEIIPEPMGEEMEEQLEVVDMEEEEGVEQQDDELFVRPRASLEEFGSKDLRGILSAWDARKRDFTEAVLETDFYTVAIWNKDDLYFVFDPKASGANGELTERRLESGKDRAAGETQLASTDPVARNQSLFLEKRNYNHFDNEGSAYTAWFSNFEEFCDHLLNKLPEEYRHDKFTLHDLTITNTPVGADDIGSSSLKPGFRPINQQHSILRGSMTQHNPALTNGGRLEFTNCLVALAFARITPSTKMTTTLLDVILKYGDRLYSKSMKSLKALDKEKFCTIDKLRLDEIAPIFSIYRIKFRWKVLSESSGNFLVTDVKKSTGKLGSIEQGTAALLVHKGYLMAFWRSEGAFFLYDPFETNPSAVLAENGLPSLSKFPKMDNLLGYMLQKFLCVNGPNTFTCYIVQIRSSPVEEIRLEAAGAEESAERTEFLSLIPKTQETFQPFMTSLKILRSPVQGDIMPDHGLALAALVHSRLQFVGLWGTNIGSRISFLSKYLVQRTECDMALAPATFDDIRRSFAIDNDILCHISFAKNIQGPVYSSKRTEIVGINLKNALITFFRSCQHMVVTIPGTATSFAVWKENGRFYLFGVDRVDSEVFVVESANLESLFEPLFRNLKAEPDTNNWYELRSVNVSTVPIRDGICKPLTAWQRNTDDILHSKPDRHKSMACREAHFFDHIAQRPEAAIIQPTKDDFDRIERKVELLFSKGVLRKHRFYGSKDFFPSLQAACVEAAALSQIRPPALWTKRTLEKLLGAGINLYINTVAVKGASVVTMIDFKGKLFVGNFELEVCPLAPTVQVARKDDLMMCLTWVLRKYRTAYLHTENFCFSLILDNNDCFLYHPGSKEELCESIRSDCSCLVRFCTISEMLDKLLTNAEISLCENVCIGPICVFKPS